MKLIIQLLMLGGAYLTPAAAANAADASTPAKAAPGPVVSVVEARASDIVETIQVTGTLVAREEILVGPEIEGSRILELLVDEGDTVARGQVLARLSRDTLVTQLAQLNAQLVRADATIEQARANIALAEAAIAQSEPALSRAKALLRTGAGTDAVLEQRASEHNSNLARLNSARRGIGVSQADKTNLEAQRDELNLKLARTDVKAPAAGLVSRRTARVGGIASMAAEPMFRIIADGDVELEAEVPDFRLQGVHEGQKATIVAPGDQPLAGKVRLVSPEIDKTSRMGRVRIAIARDPALKIGAFARAEIETRRRTGIGIPISAVLYDSEGAYAQTVRSGQVATKRIDVGLVASGAAEIRSGLGAGEVVVLRAGAFLHEGDPVEPRPVADGTAKDAGDRLGSR